MIDVFTDSVELAADTPAYRFIDFDGTVGLTKYQGVTVYGGEAGDVTSMLNLGIAAVEIADAQTLVTGDLVKPDAAGKAVKDNTAGVYKVKKGGLAGELAFIDISKIYHVV